MREIQNLIEKLFNIEGAQAATIIITLTVFILGFVLNGLVKLIGGLSRRFSNRKLFIDILSNLNQQVAKQKEAFLQTNETLNLTHDTPWIYHRAEFYQISVFREMGYREIFRAHFTGIENIFSFLRSKKYKEKKRRCFNKVWENVSNLEFWSVRSFNDFNSYIDKYNSYNDKRNDAFDKLRKLWEELFSSSSGQSGLPKELLNYLTELDNTIKPYSEIDEKERVKPYTAHTKLILPIRNLNQKFSKIIDVRHITDLALEVSNHYKNMEALIEHLKGQFKEYCDTMDKIYNSNNEAIALLS